MILSSHVSLCQVEMDWPQIRPLAPGRTEAGGGIVP